ncbi:MAG: hypothetical protein PVH41_17640, partial [Anaerolineae bacterium]
SDPKTPDMSCVPYRKKTLYLVLTVPYLAILALVAIYLWRFSPWLTGAVVLSYLWACTFQAYCCACQDCPYIGRFCPAIAGIVPASWIARWVYGGRKVEMSEPRFAAHAVLAILGWVVWTALPLFWIAKLSVGLAVAYVLWQVVYVATFFLTVCPACALRDICPGGGVQAACLGRGNLR